MGYCQHCGTPLTPGAAFCARCGTPVPGASAPTPAPATSAPVTSAPTPAPVSSAPPASPYGVPSAAPYGGTPAPYGGQAAPYGGQAAPYGTPAPPGYGPPPAYGAPPYGPPPAPTPGKPGGRKVIVLVVAIVAAVVLVGGGLTAFLLTRGGGSKTLAECVIGTWNVTYTYTTSPYSVATGIRLTYRSDGTVTANLDGATQTSDDYGTTYLDGTETGPYEVAGNVITYHDPTIREEGSNTFWLGEYTETASCQGDTMTVHGAIDYHETPGGPVTGHDEWNGTLTRS